MSNEKPCDAVKCRLWEKCINPLIPTTGSKNPDLLVIGEAPGADDDCQAGNFLTDGGNLLREILKDVGFSFDKVAFSNVVRCRPTQEKWGKTINREPLTNEIKDCKGFIMEDIEKLKPRAILLLGSVAFKAILNLTGITSCRGKVYDFQGITVVPTFHPANVIRDNTFLEYFVKDIEKVYKELYEEKVVYPPAEYTLIKNLEGLKLLVSRASDADEVSFDLETSRLNPHMEDAQIVCVSFSFVERESFIVPMYHRNMIFTGKSLSYAKSIIKVIMESPLPKIAQNAKFDMSWLMVTEGIETNNLTDDTMLMQFLLTEQAGTHGLDWLAWRYTDMGGYDRPLEDYKKSHKDCDPKRGGSYRNIPWEILAPYAGMDTDCTLRCCHILRGLI